MPFQDELLSGWLTRLATANYCDFVDILAHIGVDYRYAVFLDLGSKQAQPKRSPWLRVTPELIQSLAFPALNDTKLL
ncbi:hypothetical protein [Phyllobacterium sp. K27]